MSDITREFDVAASPDEVAAFVADLPGWPDWFALHKGWSGDIPQTAAVGVKFKHKVRVLGMPGDVTWEVSTLDPPARFVLKGKGPSRTNMEVDFRISARDGGSHIAFTAKVGGLAVKAVGGQLNSWLDVRVDRTVGAMTEALGSA